MKFALAPLVHIWNNAKTMLVIAPPINTPPAIVAPMSTSVPDVPFYSQFHDIRSPQWQKVGCGITSLAMIIDYYSPHAVSVNALLGQGIAAGAYEQNVGWIYAGLITLSQRYGLSGTYHDLSSLDSQTAFDQFERYVKDGPVILSVHYKFDPKSAIPHLVVIDAVDDGTVYYNDPAAKSGEKQISVANFLKGWKKKVIVIRPATGTNEIALANK
jgi:ABC-type bacteriocin/lantibiotic exporter with double-glycine peptidase domain